MGRRVYTDEQIEFLKTNVAGRPIRALTTLFNVQFGLQKRHTAIKTLLGRLGVSNGLGSGFKLGQGRPHKPVGSECIGGGGYVYMKDANSQWRPKHVLVWEALHGPTPKGYAVIFGDGDDRNFDPDNLLMVSRQELAVLNAFCLHGVNANLTKAGVALADLYMKISERSGRSRRQRS